MTRPTLIALALLALVSVALAAWGIGRSSRLAAGDVMDPRPLVPGLAERANEAVELDVTDATGTVTLDAAPDGSWHWREKGGYRVSRDKVRAVVAGLAGLRVVEAKTDNPERYARLDLLDPVPGSATGAYGKHVVLKGKDGAVLADMVLGKENAALGRSVGGLYVRMAGEARSWLAEGRVELPYESLAWTDRQLADLPDAAVQSLVLSGGGRPALTLTRANPEQALPSVLPPPGKPLDDGKLHRLLGLGTALSLDDVRAADGVVVLPDARTATLTSFSGLKLTLASVTLDGSVWLRVSATGSGEAAASADAIMGRTQGWLYRLPAYKAELIGWNAADLVQKPGG